MYRFSNTLPDILLRSTLALAGSALILLTAFAVYTERQTPAVAPPPQPINISGKSMQAVAGSARIAGETLEITGYQPREGELIAIAAWQGRFPADDYPLLRYQVDIVFPGPVLKLIWRTADDPGVLKSMNLPATDDGSSWLEVARHPDWHGTVLELGVYAFANDEREALSIAHLTLEPFDWRGDLASSWAEWTGYRGWSARSINRLYGTADTNALSPVLVAAAWSALAVTLLLISGLLARRVHTGALAAALLLPWISVDLLWQKELMTQLVQTRDQFAGKTVVEKHLSDSDRHIYRYISRLKDEVLPKQNTRILLLHNSHSHNFERLKAQYYLLPHNVFNFGRIPPDVGLENFDFVLVLGDVRRLDFSAQTSSLIWKSGQRSLLVELVDDDYMGRLYRVPPVSRGEEP